MKGKAMKKKFIGKRIYQKEKCICIHVYTGITSRFLSLMQAYYLARKYHIKNFIVIWRLEDCCNIKYEDVFDSKQFADVNLTVFNYGFFPPDWGDGIGKCLHNRDIKGLLWDVREWARYFMWKIRNRKADRIMRYFQNENTFVKYHPPKEIGWSGESYHAWTEKCWERVRGYLESGTNCLIDVYAGIMAGQNRTAPVDPKTLIFREKYLHKVEELITDGKWVGVHVRRTDHTGCIRESPLYVFVEKMKEIQKKDKAVKFFLATDDPQVEEELCREFPERIVTYRDKVWGRNSQSGMESAIVDFLCLSRCDQILGSYGSVFSMFSAMYGGKELISCRK